MVPVRRIPFHFDHNTAIAVRNSVPPIVVLQGNSTPSGFTVGFCLAVGIYSCVGILRQTDSGPIDAENYVHAVALSSVSQVFDSPPVFLNLEPMVSGSLDGTSYLVQITLSQHDGCFFASCNLEGNLSTLLIAHSVQRPRSRDVYPLERCPRPLMGPQHTIHICRSPQIVRGSAHSRLFGTWSIENRRSEDPRIWTTT
jgi:hypothetical protein